MQTTIQVPKISGWYASLVLALSQQDLFTLRLWFDSVDKDRSGHIDVNELATLNLGGSPLGVELAKKLIKVFDKDGNGNIDFWEYCAIHKLLVDARAAFAAGDKDRSGTLQLGEIHTALLACGFNYLSYNTFVELLKKYDPKNLGINVNTFTHMVAYLAHIRSIFDWFDVNKSGTVTLTLDQFNHSITYLS